MNLNGISLLITSGPTRESWDSIRYLTNRSSGRLGYEIALLAASLGASVKLITSINFKPSDGLEIIKIESALDMFNAVQSSFSEADIFISAAAVADFRPVRSPVKIKKREALPVIKLERNPDILKWAGEKKTGQIIVGFSLSDNNDVETAKEKMKEKNSNIMVANTIENFDNDLRSFHIIKEGHIREYTSKSLKESSERILKECLKII